MKKTLLLTVLVCATLLGCAHTHRLNQQPPEKYFERINRAVQNRRGQIVLRNGEVYSARNIHAGVDSTSWVYLKTNEKYTAQNSELRMIVIKNRGKGALEGMGLGAAIGFPIGYATLSSFAQSDPETWGGYNWHGAAIFSVGGGLISLPVGAAIGSKEKFLINQTEVLSSSKGDRP